MNTIKRITVICFAVIVLAANLPLCASAVDPVSAATMANALAQAITAYGASHGVSMTFDVASTDGIGEGVHELWNDFKEDIQDNNVPTYDSLAITMWADIYTKIGNNVGININDTEMPYIDAFWNWLLSGPAEMTKVDNEYYEWTLNNGVVDPITVYNISTSTINGITLHSLPTKFNSTGTNGTIFTYTCSDSNVYYFVTPNSAQNRQTMWFVNTNTRNFVVVENQKNTLQGVNSNTNLNSSLDDGWYFVSRQTSSDLPLDSDLNASWIYQYLGVRNANTDISYEQSDISVRPYVGDTTPQDVYIPDNQDVNYVPLPYVGGLDIPWDDSLFGDGSGTFTDAQSEAISGVVDDAITDSLEKTLTLADTENPDIPAPNEVYIPLLPVELPSFNFSLSGIWHYVVSWVQSLGAWLSLMFQTWSVLPSAITIPVYATAVIVIVLGVYKRFFM